MEKSNPYSIKKQLDNKVVYNKTFLKLKIKPCINEATDFHDDEMPKEGVHYICLVVVLIDFVLEKEDKKTNYYLQVFLQECKYIEKEKQR